MDQSGNMQNRRSRRAPVLLAASIDVRGTAVSVKLRNLSAQGALIESEQLPAEGAITFFTRKELRLKCQVMWVAGRYAGIRFNRELGREEVLRHIPKPREAMKPDFRRPGLTSKPLTMSERKMIEAWIVQIPRDHLGE